MGARPRPPQRLAAYALLAALGGCSFASFADDGRCVFIDDCQAGEACVFVEASNEGFCVAQADDNPLTLAIEISPNQGLGLLRHQALISASDLVAPITSLPPLALSPAVDVEGTVVALNVSGFPQALVRATPAEAPIIRGTPREVFEAISSSEQGNFSLAVRPGLYDLTVTPLSQDPLPPLVLREVALPLPEGERLNLVLQGGDILRGSLLAGGAPLQGMRVVARALGDDGVPDPDLRSTIAVTDKDGGYTLVLPREVSEFVLQTEPAEALGDNAFIPTQVFSFETEGLPLLDEALQLGPLDVGPRVEPLLFVGHASGPAANAAAPFLDAPENTTIDFTRVEEEDSTARFSRRAVVGVDGSFSVELLPGRYHITISTSAASELASGRVDDIDTSACPEEPCSLELLLERRHNIFGEILDPLGDNSFAQFSVEARPAGLPEAAAVGNVLSDEAGRGYQLLLDPGVYDLLFVPPATGGLSTGMLFSVDSRKFDPLVADVQLFSSSLVTGQVVAANTTADPKAPSTPVQATVRIFARSTSGAFYPVFTTSTNALGQFVVVVPNPPPGTAQLAPLLDP